MKLNDYQDESPAPVAPILKPHPQLSHSNRTTRVRREKKVRWAPSVISDDSQTETPTQVAEPANLTIKRHSSLSRQPSLHSDGFMREDFFSRDFIPAWNESTDGDFHSSGKWDRFNSHTTPVQVPSKRRSAVGTQVIPPAVPDAPIRGPPRTPRPTRLRTPDLSDELESDFCDCCDRGNHARQRFQPIYQISSKWSGDAGDKMKAQVKAAQAYQSMRLSEPAQTNSKGGRRGKSRSGMEKVLVSCDYAVTTGGEVDVKSTRSRDVVRVRGNK